MATTRRAPSASSARVSPPGPGPTSTTVTPSRGPPARARRDVVSSAGAGVKHRIGRQRTARIDPFGFEALDRGAHRGDILLPHGAIFAGVWVESRHRKPRLRDAESAGEITRGDATGFDD